LDWPVCSPALPNALSRLTRPSHLSSCGGHFPDTPCTDPDLGQGVDRSDRTLRQKLQDRPMTTVWIYVDTSRQVGDLDHLKVFIDEVTANTWLSENDPEGMAFEYEVLE
jgi:hypothetical protein